MILKEKTLQSKYEFKGKILKVKNDIVELENGQRANREICEHPGGVAVLAVDDAGMCAMVEQYRYAFAQPVLEIPAGKIENHDGDYSREALRELEEETGIVPEKLEFLCSIYPSPGCMTEVIYLYFASGLKVGQAKPDQDEFLNVRWMDIGEIKSMIAQGDIKDAKVISALYTAELKGLI